MQLRAQWVLICFVIAVSRVDCSDPEKNDHFQVFLAFLVLFLKFLGRLTREIHNIETASNNKSIKINCVLNGLYFAFSS